MSEAMCTMRVVRVSSQRSLDFRPSRRKLPVFGKRHSVIGHEPKIITVVRGQAVHQHGDLVLLSDAAIRPLGFAALATTRASRGHAARCSYRAAIAASARPA